MTAEHPTIAPEIIACISEDRDPTVHELARVADRIERDVFGDRSAFSWDREPTDPSRIASMRIALAALTGIKEESALVSRMRATA